VFFQVGSDLDVEVQFTDAREEETAAGDAGEPLVGVSGEDGDAVAVLRVVEQRGEQVACAGVGVGDGEGLAVLQPVAEVGELSEQVPQLGSEGVGGEGVQAEPGAGGEQPLVGAVLVVGGLDKVLGETSEGGGGGVEGAQFPEDEIVLRVDPFGAAQHGGPQGPAPFGCSQGRVRAIGQRPTVESAQTQKASQGFDQLPRSKSLLQRDDAEKSQLGPEFRRGGVAQAGRDQPLGHLSTVEQWPSRVLGYGGGEVRVTAAPCGHDGALHSGESSNLGHRHQEGCRGV
jgi:hypothetical protein